MGCVGVWNQSMHVHKSLKMEGHDVSKWKGMVVSEACGITGIINKGTEHKSRKIMLNLCKLPIISQQEYYIQFIML